MAVNSASISGEIFANRCERHTRSPSMFVVSALLSSAHLFGYEPNREPEQSAYLFQGFKRGIS